MGYPRLGVSRRLPRYSCRGAREIWEAHFHSSIEQESFAYIFAEVNVTSIVGALLFAIVAEIRNRQSFRADHVAGKKGQHLPR